MAVAAIRMVSSRSIGYSPSKMLYGQEGLEICDINARLSTEKDFDLNRQFMV